MRMMRVAFLNFKNSFHSYLSLVLSLAFTVLVFLNFQNIVYSDALDVLGRKNRDYVDMLVQTVSFVLVCFMFFFVWYATNIFLTKRKKEIGIYVFMGLTNEKIGRMYLIETVLTGLSALVLGLVTGLLTTGLFQMILLALSELAVDIRFQVSLQPVVVTAAIYLAIYVIFGVKGYINIVRSSVRDMISAAKQNEYVRQKTFVLFCKTLLGIAVVSAGCLLAIKEETGDRTMGNALSAVVLVTVGVYLLFGGLLPMIYQGMVKNKRFLYKKQRALWVNQMIFRMKKNYRTYAMVCVLAICATTALATGFAMKQRYKNIIHFENEYTFQLLSVQDNLDEKAKKLLLEKTELAYSATLPLVQLDNKVVDGPFGISIVPYSGVKELAKRTGLAFSFAEPADDEMIKASHLMLLTLITDRSNIYETVNGKKYHRVAETSVPYLGYLQSQMDVYIVSDAEYGRLCPLGQQFYTYSYRIADLDAFAAAKEALRALSSDAKDTYTGCVSIDPAHSDIDYIKVFYSLCIFMFLVFIIACGSIMFMKLYNDAFEERERYLVLKKLGFAEKTLGMSIACELATAYAAPFFIMCGASYFSVHALEKMMIAGLMPVYGFSLLVVFAIFSVCYVLSVASYRKIVTVLV